MTKEKNREKITINDIRNSYHRGENLTMLTSYDYTMARMIDEAGVDMILVGDSLGMVVQGEKTTLPVTIEDVIYHTKAVAKGIQYSHVMADMPFLSYHASHDEAVRNAGKLIQAGAESVKLECGEEFADLIWYLKRIGIPVMAHVGLKPQSVNTMGGYKVQGKSKSDADEIIRDVKILEEAGAFGFLLEGIPTEVAEEITQSVKVPTIGIGSGQYCSGQVLVSYDLLGANPEFKPKFVRRYMDLHGQVQKAIKSYVSDVKTRKFPNENESFHRNLFEVKISQDKK